LTGPNNEVGVENLRLEIGLRIPNHHAHRPPTDHRCLVQEWKGGKFQEVSRVDLKQRWPDKWEKDWLGW
jgi:branched-chain amino acid transport system substrate-binding protein